MDNKSIGQAIDAMFELTPERIVLRRMVVYTSARIRSVLASFVKLDDALKKDICDRLVGEMNICADTLDREFYR